MSKPKFGPQDLPPKGGYRPFQIDRVKLQQVIAGRWGLGILLATNIIGFPIYYKKWIKYKKEKIEFTSMQLAAVPILCAERDRKATIWPPLLYTMKTERNRNLFPKVY